MMKSRALFVAGMLLSLCCGTRARAAAAETRPNILFFLIDDMGYNDFSCFGGVRAHTTHIDQCASEGIKFTQFYVAEPICSPSRVGFTTGQFPVRWHITSYLDNRKMDHERGMADWLDPKAPVLARMLHDAGYYTAHVGKWHMGGQRDVGDAPHIETYGFDRALTTFEGLAAERILPTFEPYNPKDPYKYPQVRTAASLPGPFTNVRRYRVSEKLVDRAIEEIKTAREKGKPFYINLWPDDVHSPNEAPPDMRGDNTPPANYVGVLNELDHQFGRIYDYIKSDPELRDNTIILIASDNGPEKGLGYSDDLRGSKGQLWEGGIRLPLICWGPKFLTPSAVGTTNSKTVIDGIDFPPSILALTGVTKTDGVKFDGLDMSSVLLGKEIPDRSKPMMWVRPPDRPGPPKNRLPDLAIREGNWKLLIWKNESKPAELFDIIADPDEKTDRAAGETAVVKHLTDELMAWDRQVEPSSKTAAAGG
ncbi:MAG TPA: sulfatase-like hydrolase/transferase [Tepidisphaeraceae bacterium]|jgi:uncharacterized sulfatase|nr:sulfatase-like hydrolase/transferase [Tepidisphaeraceae bacterium]